MSKKVIRFLVFHNWVWTLPLTIGLFFISRLFHVNWITALIGTAGSMAGIFVIGRACLWFFFRTLFEYFYGIKVKPPVQKIGQPVQPFNPQHNFYNHSVNDFIKSESRSYKLTYATIWFMLMLVMAVLIFIRLL